MTSEHRLIVSLDEIAAVRWQCRRCSTAISYRLDQTITSPELCPGCRERATDRFAAPAPAQAFDAFIDALKGLRRVEGAKPTPTGSIYLEFVVRDPSG